MWFLEGYLQNSTKFKQCFGFATIAHYVARYHLLKHFKNTLPVKIPNRKPALPSVHVSQSESLLREIPDWRIAINVSTSVWWLEGSRVLQGQHQGWYCLASFFTDDLDDGIECKNDKPKDDTKLGLSRWHAKY